MPRRIQPNLPRYHDFDPLVAVWCLTPDRGGCIHRFFDTSPLSPSGRYAALTRLPYEDRLPSPGDPAEIVVVDLLEGTEEAVAETRGWDTQLGAQAQWGATDGQLFFNDADPSSWRAFGVKLDPFSGDRLDLDGPVYMISPDGRNAAGPCLLRTGAVQPGYGVIVPDDHVPRNRGASGDDGLYVTDTRTGRCRLLVSYERIVGEAEPRLDPSEYAEGDFYGFHVKWSPRGDRLMFVLRWRPRDPAGKLKHNLLTMNADGSRIRVALSEHLWGRGGHHPNWCPDGDHVLMNLNLDGRGMRFVRFSADGGQPEVLAPDITGSGHPTMHPDGRHVLTDAYLHGPFGFGREPFTFDDGTVQLRWIDWKEQHEKALIRVNVNPPFTGPGQELRIDPHPAWDRGYRRVVFNGWAGGARRVYMADLGDLIDGGDAA